MSKGRRIESPADTRIGTWCKCEEMPTSERAHFWRPYSLTYLSRSSCGMIRQPQTLAVVGERFPRCLNCEALERGKAGGHG
jgi:hypothetical protein